MKKLLFLVIALCAGFMGQAKNKTKAFVYFYDLPKGLYDYFIKADGDNWEEISVVKNNVKYHFKSVSEEPEQTILYDESRSNYIRLTTEHCYVGTNKANATRKLYDGEWVTANDGPSPGSLIDKKVNFFTYNNRGGKGFFTRSGSKWMEYSYNNAMLLATYTVTEETDSYIILFCTKWGFYIKLTDDACYYSTSVHGDYERRCEGSWQRGGVAGHASKGGSKAAAAGSHSGRSFFYYLKSSSYSYHGYFEMTSKGWDEVRISDGKVLFHYTLIADNADEIILFDESRTVYVRLTSSELYWGSTRESINEKLYFGTWERLDASYSLSVLMELEINIFIFEYSSYKGYYTRSGDGRWLEYGYTSGILMNTYIIIEESTTYIILYCGSCGYYAKLTDDGVYYSPTRDGEYKKRGDGRWTQGKVQNGPYPKKPATASATGAPAATAQAPAKTGVSADPLTALKSHVKDSLTRLMKLPNLSAKAIADKKIDKKNLETVAADIARQYLATLKKAALKKFSGKAVKISAYDKQKQVYTLIWNSDIFIVPVPAAEAESFKTNWGKMAFAEPDFYFDGNKFRLSALKITNPVLKKTYVYDTRNQKRAAPSIKVGDVDVALPVY